MKKTKILVPAMAVLALGMAAAVTGTVAWYSSTNVVYANNLQIQSKTAQSLQIALTSSGTWGTMVSHSATMNTDVNPAYCLTAQGNSNAEPSFVYLDTNKVDNPGTGDGQDAWFVDSAGKVREFVATLKEGSTTEYEQKIVAPAAEAEGNPWLNDSRNAETGKFLNVQSGYDWLKLDTTETGKSETVSVTVDFARSLKKPIDQAMVFGFYNHTSKAWAYVKPFAGDSTNGAAQVTSFANLTVTENPSQYSFYMWYDGEDALTINENAFANPISATITYSIVTNP